MPTPRDGLAVVTTNDGRLFAIGGEYYTSTYNSLSTVEAYNPATNAWTTMAPMPTASYGVSASVGINGDIYVFGGYDYGNLNTVQVYDPTTNVWSSAAAMPVALNGTAAVTGTDGRIYVIGGNTTGGGPSTSSVEVYDPASNTWSTAASMPLSLEGLTASRGADGRIYVFGGLTSPGSSVNDTALVYDPIENTWSQLAEDPTTRCNLSSSTGANGIIYVAGGQSAGPNGTVFSTFESFNPSTNSWTVLNPMPTARAGLGVTTGLDGTIYAVGGWDIQQGNQNSLNTVEAYVLTSIAATQPSWDATNGGVDYGYTISGADLPQATTVDLDWASGTTVDTVIGTPITSTTTETAQGTYQLHATPSQLGTPPAGATYLLEVADPGNLVSPADPSKVASLALSSLGGAPI